ncbi:MAG: hypothetical protein AB1758_03780 [Candidatus Eremiobacterota bacterium]
MSFPMTSNGRAGYVAPRDLQEARSVHDRATIQSAVNEALATTCGVVDFLLKKNVANGLVDGNGVVASPVSRDHDLNPDANVVALSGSSFSVASGKYFKSSEDSSDAFLQVRRAKERPDEDPLRLVQRLQVEQTDGWTISMTGEENHDRIHYHTGRSDRPADSMTIWRDHRNGVLTVMFEAQEEDHKVHEDIQGPEGPMDYLRFLGQKMYADFTGW